MFSDPAVGPKPRLLERRLTLAIAVVCSVVGLVLGANAASPGVLSSLSTLMLFGIVVLTIFPALTLLLVRFELKAQKSLARSNTVATQRTQARITTHDAHDRPARAHTRLVTDSSTQPELQEHAV